MDLILENLAVGSYEDGLSPPPEINALLCVAREKDVNAQNLLYHKVPITDMQPIPPEQLKEAGGYATTFVTTGSWSSAMPGSGGRRQWSLPICAA